MTNTSPDLWRPSSSARSCETTRSITPPESPDLPRLGASESNSSKNMTQGEAPRAFWKTWRTFSSDWPTYMLISSGPFTLQRLIPNTHFHLAELFICQAQRPPMKIKHINFCMYVQKYGCRATAHQI